MVHKNSPCRKLTTIVEIFSTTCRNIKTAGGSWVLAPSPPAVLRTAWAWGRRCGPKLYSLVAQSSELPPHDDP
jgi:hypothetical protein